MKKPILLTLLTLTLSLSAFAVDRHQSFISYDEGGTIVRSGEDGREVEAQRNLPVYPEDEIITARRGRAEVRLSDGNIIGIDRATALRFRSILDSYEGNSEETVAELRYGKVAIYRTDLGQDVVRLDTENASYVAEHEGVYSVETDARGADQVQVFEGSVEVRTPTRATRIRAGETASVDGRGVFDSVADQRNSADEFERWFLKRAERFDSRSSQYVDRRLLYWADDLDDYGTWVNVSGIGNVWRPTVAVGWRPYYRGYWHRSRWGSLTWVSYDPWGWGTYHYGRWSHDPFNGWYWVPGFGYSPAWVYWMYGSSYVGWAPSGWWDCYPRYYDWAYRPYRNHGVNFGFGFYGRVNMRDMDLRPWTFVDSVGLISTRVDRAALTADAVKHRLGRSGGFATVSGKPARMTNEDMRDPAEAIRRRGLDGREGRMTGRETGAPPADLTPFFRRDANVSGAIRDRLVVRGGSNGSGATTRSGSGSVAPIGSGSVAPIGRGSVAPVSGGTSAPTGGAVERRRDGSGSTGSGSSGSSGTIRRGSGSSGSGSSGSTSGSTRRGTVGGGGSWRGGNGSGDSGSNLDVVGSTTRGDDGAATSPRSRGIRRETTPSEPAPVVLPDNSTERSGSRGDSWRGGGSSGQRSTSGSGESTDRGSSDVPRRVIDRIGGARIVPRESTRESGSSSRGSDRSGSVERPRRTESGSSSGSARSGSSGSGSSSSSSGSSSRSSGSSGSSGGSRSSGGRIGRDQ